MKSMGNILWFLLGGFLSGAAWLIAGALCCITVIGLPLGRQCFKLSTLSFCPFGKEVGYGGGAASFLANILWIIFLGLWMALGNLLLGLILCITVIGIPFGLQFFKLAKLSLFPFGAEVYRN